jgi:hypothetical protein
MVVNKEIKRKCIEVETLSAFNARLILAGQLPNRCLSRIGHVWVSPWIFGL